ncbi:MAG: DUF1192 domain-containing protein [Pseudomonadota bacterium]
MDWDEPKHKRLEAIQPGDDLDAVSINELEERITAMRQEIARCEAAIAAKIAQRDAAASIFKS